MKKVVLSSCSDPTMCLYWVPLGPIESIYGVIASVVRKYLFSKLTIVVKFWIDMDVRLGPLKSIIDGFSKTDLYAPVGGGWGHEYNFNPTHMWCGYIPPHRITLSLSFSLGVKESTRVVTASNDQVLCVVSNIWVYSSLCLLASSLLACTAIGFWLGFLKNILEFQNQYM